MLMPFAIMIAIFAVITTPGLIALHLEDRRQKGNPLGDAE